MSSTATTEPRPPINYVFVDYENVHDVDLSVIGTKTVYLTLLLGARQTKLDAELVEKLIQHAASVQLVRLSSSGKNALDFALAYYMGKAVNADPTAYFHIVSKDTGFDPLIEHLRTRHIHARRHNDYTSLTFLAAPKPPTVAPKLPPKPTPKPLSTTRSTAPKPPTAARPTPPKPSSAAPEDLLTRVLTHLRKNTSNRPKRKKTLLSHLAGLCGKTATEADMNELIEKLHKAGHLKIGDKEAVTYHLDPK